MRRLNDHVQIPDLRIGGEKNESSPVADRICGSGPFVWWQPINKIETTQGITKRILLFFILFFLPNVAAHREPGLSAIRWSRWFVVNYTLQRSNLYCVCQDLLQELVSKLLRRDRPEKLCLSF